MNKVYSIVLFAFLVFNIGTISGQSSEVRDLVEKMFNDVQNKDFESLLEITHPKVFEIVPKEQMLTLIKNMFEGNDEFSIELPENKPEYFISELFQGKENNLEYAFVNYDMSIKMTFNNQEFDEETKKMMKPMMKAQGMEIEFLSKNAMQVLMKDRLVIILKEEATKNKWVMVNYDADSPLFYQVISSDLLETAKEYKQNLMLETKKSEENSN
ncbi:hypothetical protein [Seonamhaeicola marinus]|uniref:Uncharacterized protein n=1 Tax=Seonamhaeicola marinus TaxID=1912246 RepID=A0A5D0I711_9FLAO|nr:hypothetical protein [Seonamhaeicola marinus]TYA78650.1 hypothetical protein FUA24_09875 [Seonamhaeicola marinus]